MKTLENCENMFGSISPQIQKRIKNYIKKPSFDKWDDIHCIIVKSENMGTIWNAMLDYDSTFPKHGRSEDYEGNIIREWGRIPTQYELLSAITNYTN